MAQKARDYMAQYFTREEAEALLPQITVVLLQNQEPRQGMQQSEEELGALHAQAMGNGHHLHGRITKVQKELAQHLQTLQALVVELDEFGCVLKDPDMGLIDFLSLRNGLEVYLCLLLGGERLNYWLYLEPDFR